MSFYFRNLPSNPTDLRNVSRTRAETGSQVMLLHYRKHGTARRECRHDVWCKSAQPHSPMRASAISVGCCIVLVQSCTAASCVEHVWNPRGGMSFYLSNFRATDRTPERCCELVPKPIHTSCPCIQRQVKKNEVDRFSLHEHLDDCFDRTASMTISELLVESDLVSERL